MIAIVHPKLAEASFGRVIQPLLNAPCKFEKLGVRLVAFLFPYLDVDLDWRRQNTQVRLRVDGTDFPYRPIGGWWVDANGTPLLSGSHQVPSGRGFHVVNQDNQPNCWFCFRGWREYHNHSSHQDLSWASIRRDQRYSVLQLVMQLATDLNGEGVTKV